MYVHTPSVCAPRDSGRRTFNGIQIVCSDGNQGAATTDVLVKLVLQINKGGISGGGEFDSSQHGADNEGADSVYLGLGGHREHVVGLDGLVFNHFVLSEEDTQSTGDAFDTEQVVPVGGYVDLVQDSFGQTLEEFGITGIDFSLLHHHLLLGGDVIQLDAELEAQHIEFVVGIRLFEHFEEVISVDKYVRMLTYMFLCKENMESNICMPMDTM